MSTDPQQLIADHYRTKYLDDNKTKSDFLISEFHEEYDGLKDMVAPVQMCIDRLPPARKTRAALKTPGR